MNKIPYEHAAPDECGRQYRPGQVPPETSYCRLRLDHPSFRHSTRRHRGDDAGFEWFDAEESELEWPVRTADESMELFEARVAAYMVIYPEQRLGQACSNVLWVEGYRDWRDEIQATELDPFYMDERVPAFRTWLRSKFEEDE